MDISAPQPEPWLRGPLEGVAPHVMPVFHSFAQVREDLARHVAPLTGEQLWREMPGGSAGFHLKHMAGSIDRLTAYLFGEQLTADQLSLLAQEHLGYEPADVLVTRVQEAMAEAERKLESLPAHTLYELRTVGRSRLPTFVMGLVVHLAEHTQRHLGQLITLAHQLRAG